MKQIIKKGKTSYLALIYIEDSVTHLGKAGLINTSVTAAFARADQGNANATAISLSAGTRGTWSSGGFKEKDATAMPGWYELGIPDAAWRLVLTGLLSSSRMPAPTGSPSHRSSISTWSTMTRMILFGLA